MSVRWNLYIVPKLTFQSRGLYINITMFLFHTIGYNIHAMFLFLFVSETYSSVNVDAQYRIIFKKMGHSVYVLYDGIFFQ